MAIFVTVREAEKLHPREMRAQGELANLSGPSCKSAQVSSRQAHQARPELANLSDFQQFSLTKEHPSRPKLAVLPKIC